MQLIEKISDIKNALANFSGRKIALVPTMGALHEGHLALVRKARESADIVVVSIFVNKAQFNDLRDYEKYPRQLADDLEKLKNCADFVFAPQDVEINQMKLGDFIIPQNLKNCLCGSSRPGHFEGMIMIVEKLFSIIKPNIAIFGQKDFQQFLIIKNFVQTKNLSIEILPFEIVREKSGLAMSSRNQRLSLDNQIKAANIYKILLETRSDLLLSQREISEIIKEKSQKLLSLGFEKIDYFEVRKEDDLKLITNFSELKSSRIFIALYLSGIRLIDNIPNNYL